MSMYLSKPDLIRWTADQLARARASIERSDAPKVLDTAKEAIYERLFDVIHEGKFDLPEPEPRTVEVIREVPAPERRMQTEPGTAKEPHRRFLRSALAVALVQAYLQPEHTFAGTPFFRRLEHQGFPKCNDGTQLKHWGLIEKAGRGNVYRVTDLGQRFVMHETKVPLEAWIANDACDRLSGDLVAITDVLLPHDRQKFIPARILRNWP